MSWRKIAEAAREAKPGNPAITLCPDGRGVALALQSTVSPKGGYELTIPIGVTFEGCKVFVAGEVRATIERLHTKSRRLYLAVPEHRTYEVIVREPN